MKILWLDINSSYSHSSVALPAIHAQMSEDLRWEWCVVRGTINDNPGTIAAEVAAQKPDIIAATFWLFTHSMQIEVLSRVSTLLEGVKIICGGPEFLGDNENFLRTNHFVTAVIRGEGEKSLPHWLEALETEGDWKDVDGLCWIDCRTGAYRDNGIARVADFAALKYPEQSCFFNWDKPFVQLETTRGCFNTCSFCVSGGEKPVRYQSIEQVQERLDNICSHGIQDIRVLDRTFNYDTVRACEMLDIFTEYSGRMRFHLEIHPALISEPLKRKLESLPAGLLHLEAGIQSLDSKVLEASGRKGSLEASLKGLVYLCSLENIQTHADLIAGLPEYDLKTLCHDIAKLISIGVDELQIESLKVLPGTKMRDKAKALGLKYSPTTPYEVLQTPDMSAVELLKAMQVSRMVDLYYNCPLWQKVIRNMISVEFIIDFTDYLKTRMMLDSPVSVERRGIILYEYCRERSPERLPEVSIAWIEGGLSLKKEPAGNVTRIKHLEAFLETESLAMKNKYGQADISHRYFLLESGNRNFIFGFDSRNHQASPVFMGELTKDI